MERQSYIITRLDTTTASTGIAENGVIFQVVTISLQYIASTSLFVFHWMIYNTAA